MVSTVLCARSIKPLEGSRWRLRRMREEVAYGISISYRTINKLQEKWTKAAVRSSCMTSGA
jgi:hypothetical protein